MQAHDHPAYTRLPSGCGFSTVLPDMDFETFSTAGYIYNETAKKWQSIVKSPPHGLGAVGAEVYTAHPSARVLSLAYNLKDGIGERLWVPGMPPPFDLFQHVADGHVLEAWNSAFEFHVWQNICTKRLGWPPLPYTQLRDAMAKARAWSLPGALGKAAEVTNAAVQKNKDGTRLLNKFSKGRNPTKHDPRTVVWPHEEPEDAGKLYAYNIDDIRSEAAVSALVPDLSPEELDLWLLDQKINFNGVHIDRVALDNCTAIIEQAFARYEAELYALTNGVVDSVGKLEKLKGWLGARGVHMDDMTADTIEETLADWNYPDAPGYNAAKRAIEIRSLVGSASVKKLFAINRRISNDDRLRDLFAYCGADRTGRFAGRGSQPQNLPNSGPTVKKCSCGEYFGAHRESCPWCHRIGGKITEWCIEAVECALRVMASRDLSTVEDYFGDAVATVSGCLRGLFSAAPGHDFICSDYSAIEAVVLAMLAGESWREEVFRTHGRIYEMSAAKITGIPFEDFLQYKRDTGDHHPMRKKVGKVAELACFTRETRLLTKRGYVSIADVKLKDQLWDGLEWVNHDGVINKGKREVIDLDGMGVTPNHPISLGTSWKEARLLALNKSTLTRALAIGSGNSPLLKVQRKIKRGGLLYSVTVAVNRILLPSLPFLKVPPLDALNAAVKKAAILTSKNTLNMPRSFPTTITGGGLSTGYPQLSGGAITRILKDMLIMAREVSGFVMGGVKTAGHSLNTLLLSRDGIGLNWIWTESTLTVGIDQATYDSYPAGKIIKTNAQSLNSKKKLTNYATVYDIVNAGPRNRFTVQTNSGHLIVHNSGFAGWLGAWKAFGADKHIGSDREIKNAILAWREASPNIVEFWGGQVRKHPHRWEWWHDMHGLEGAAVAAIQNPGQCFEFRGIKYGVKDDVLYCELLSGRKLCYHQPRLTPVRCSRSDLNTFQISYMGWNSDYKKGPKGWMRLETYGGKLTENVVQAIARDILVHALKNLDAAGYSIVLHVHDEAVVEVLEGRGSIEDVERIMAIMPWWALGWPIKAAGGWRGKRYRKD